VVRDNREVLDLEAVRLTRRMADEQSGWIDRSHSGSSAAKSLGTLFKLQGRLCCRAGF
jgi:hypothetical protein